MNGLTIDSLSNRFFPGANFPPGSSFNTNTNAQYATFTFGNSFGDFDIGPILPTGMFLSDVTTDLGMSYTLDSTSGTFADMTVVAIPEPAPILLLLGIVSVLLLARPRRIP